METVAPWDGLRFASDLGYTRIMIESDALEVGNLCNSKNFERADIGGMCRQADLTGMTS